MANMGFYYIQSYARPHKCIARSSSAEQVISLLVRKTSQSEVLWGGAVKTIIFEGSRHAREASQGAPENEAPIVTTPTVQEELISGLMDAAWVESIFRQTRLISWLPSSGQGHPAA